MLFAMVVMDSSKGAFREPGLGAVQRKKFKKSENTMEVGWWVQVSLGIFSF